MMYLHTRHFPLLVVAIVAFVCLGCGSPKAEDQPSSETSQASAAKPAESPAPSADLDPRKLITQEEASAILKQKVTFSEPEKLGQFASTTMENDKGNMLATLQVSTITTSKEKFDSDVAESSKLLDAKFEPVEGLGEGAYWMDGLLQVFHKGRCVQVTVPTRPGLEPKAAAKSILEKALVNLE